LGATVPTPLYYILADKCEAASATSNGHLPRFQEVYGGHDAAKQGPSQLNNWHPYLHRSNLYMRVQVDPALPTGGVLATRSAVRVANFASYASLVCLKVGLFSRLIGPANGWSAPPEVFECTGGPVQGISPRNVSNPR